MRVEADIMKMKRQGGFTLIEVMVSILIFSFGVIAMVGLQAASIGNMIQGTYRTNASLLANRVLGQMMVDKSNVASYADSAGTSFVPKKLWLDDVKAALPNGGATVVISGSQVTVVVSWRNNNEPVADAHKYTAVGQVAF